MRTIAIIPARSGSVRIPRKNLQHIGDRTLVSMAAECAREAGLEFVIATDHPDMADGRPYTQIPRAIADGDLADVARVIAEGFPADAYAILQPATPARTGAIIRAMLDSMERLECAAALTGVPTVWWHWRHRGGRALTSWGGGQYPRSQSFAGQTWWQEVNSVQIARRDVVLAGKRWDLPLLVHLLPPYACLDIDTPRDLERARMVWPWMQEALRKDPGDGQRVVYGLEGAA